MDENKDGVQQKEYQVIQEQIVPKKKNKWKKWCRTLCRTVGLGLLFGVIAGPSLVISGSILIDKLGLDGNGRRIVGFGDTTPTPKAVPTKSPTPMPTKAPTASAEPLPTGAVPTMPDITPQITVTIGRNPEGDPADGTEQKETIKDFLNIYASVSELARTSEKSLVRVTAITEGVDWFEEAYETRENASGLYVADNGVDMLFLVNLDSIEGATKFEITFSNGERFSSTIFSYDTNYRLAVLAVRLSAVSGVEEESLPVKAKFTFNEVEAGIPVMVLGNPNGHAGAMELGMTTGVNRVVPVVDDEVLYFTTGITQYASGDGFVFNLSGEVIGIVSNTLNSGETGVFTAAMVSGMREIIEHTLNNMPRVYCGLRLEAVEKVMTELYSLPEGIYVTDVLPSSPAMAAGIKTGDIITQAGETPITEVRQFYEAVSSVSKGKNIRITVSREIKGVRTEQIVYLTPEERMH
ncbi:MAG: PDZ domain-containing protein [Lachnospiraceae bacterium]|nr:PDZ domain-containing protein [Lachnospiraceae bacterium]